MKKTAMLCFCRSGAAHTLGMLCCYVYLRHGAVHSRGYLGQEYGNECHDRERTVPGVFHCGVRHVTPDFFRGCSAWIYPRTFLAVSMLRASVSVLCSDTRGQPERKGMFAGHKGAAYQICETKILPADSPVCLPGVQMQIF